MRRLTFILSYIGVAGSLCACAPIPSADAPRLPRGPTINGPELQASQERARDNWLNPAHCSGAGGDCGIR